MSTEAGIASIPPAAVTATPTPDSPAPAAPTLTIDAARARRAEIMNDQTMVDRIYKGDAVARAEMKALNKTIAESNIGEVVQSALTGKAAGMNTTEGVLTPADYASAAATLTPALGNQAFMDVVVGTPVTQERHDEAVQMKKIVMSDRDWVRAYMKGSEAHQQQMTRILANIVAPIIGK
jgi:hypothetical protein